MSFADINIGKGRLQGEGRKPDYTESNFPVESNIESNFP
jgi:hypothetical protein